MKHIMKIAVVGKGGSGKSSVSWLLTEHILQNSNKKVLAIDADYNMDFSYLLAPEKTDIKKVGSRVVE